MRKQKVTENNNNVPANPVNDVVGALEIIDLVVVDASMLPEQNKATKKGYKTIVVFHDECSYPSKVPTSYWVVGSTYTVRRIFTKWFNETANDGEGAWEYSWRIFCATRKK